MTTTKDWEKAIINILNLDGWNLKWTGDSFEHYDAIGKTPKGFDCIMEIKTRNSYYTDKIIEKYKYDKLMAFNGMKFYFVADSNGNYLYYLNTLILPELKEIQVGATTNFENNNKVLKQVYYLSESQASILNKNK